MRTDDPHDHKADAQAGPGGDRSAYERMRAGEEYRDADAEIQARQRHGQALMQAYNASSVTEPDARRGLLEQLLGSVGEGTVIRPPFYVDYGSHITVGTGTFANYGLVALDVAPITIGDRVQIATNVQLLTPTHPLDADRRRDGWEAAEPITIGDNVWLGGGAIVLPGITVGPDTVVGAGAVVTRDLPAGVLALGNPARVVRQL